MALTYTPPLESFNFLLAHVCDAEKRLAALPPYKDMVSLDLLQTVLAEGGKLCAEEFAPLNASGDEQGCKWHEGGVVTAPKGFKKAFEAYTQGGWNGLSADPTYGGQGLPQALNTMMAEMISSANMALGMYPGLTQGAINAIKHYGSDAIKQTFLPPMIAGAWTGTMNLTEPHCGTDLGLIRTKAVPNADGTFSISGTKIFISCGEHDVAENIIHLVLARLPDAPEGVKGISLFVVPKFLVQADGTLGARNAAVCGSIEHKMGIHGSSTCVMNFDGATGQLVGEPHKGLKAMFVMMNEARLHVGMQGLGIAEMALQAGMAYANDRRQGRALNGAREPDKPADRIIVHPEIRKQLAYSQAVVWGLRWLAVETALRLDESEHAATPEERQVADDWVSLMTPIIKAYGTDMGFEVANLTVQIHGGVGYCRDYGVEQLVRDARIAQIYEGTNGIQALDLVGRKAPEDFGRLLRRFFHPALELAEGLQAHPLLGEAAGLAAKSLGRLQQGTMWLGEKSLKNKDEAGGAATDYLRAFALNVMAHGWLKMAAAAVAHDPRMAKQILPVGQFFFTRILPEADMRLKTMMAGVGVIPEFG